MKNRYFFAVTLLMWSLGGCGGSNDSQSNAPPPAPPTYRLQGVVSAALGHAVDSDVNDPQAPRQSNDTRDTAQVIPNPVTVGGYVNLPGSGAPGVSRVNGDRDDWYRVTLAAGQSVNLLIAGDGRLNDLDLFIADANGNLLDSSLGQSQREVLTVTEAGDYLVLVTTFRGASNYVLTVGQLFIGTAFSSNHLQLNDAFVPEEIIVKWADTLAQQPAKAHAFGLSTVPHTQRNQLIALGNLPSSFAKQADFLDKPLDVTLTEEQSRKLATLYAVKRLRLEDDVLMAEPNYWRVPYAIPNDEFYPLQWHYPQINLPPAWDISSGQNTIVAVIDTGVLLNHPDLQGQWVAGYDFIRDPRNAADGDGIDPDPSDPGDGRRPDGSGSYHGTHVAGTVAAATNNGIGVAGVAFGARIMPLRVLGRLGGTDYDIEQALRFAAGLPNDSGTVPARRADVVNLSLGGTAFSAASQAVYRQVRQAGVIIVAAAGNEGTRRPSYPAAYDGVVAVSAVDINKDFTNYSNFGNHIAVAAPGGDLDRDINGDGHPDGVFSTLATENRVDPINPAVIFTYRFSDGTSMAAPHVAGVIALMRAINPALTPQSFDNLLASGTMTEDLGASGRDERFGFGLINGYQAVIAAANQSGNPITPIPLVALNPTALNFGLGATRLSLTLSNGGGGSLTVQGIAADVPWLQVRPDAVNASGLGRYTVTADRQSLEDGLYTATVTVQTDAGRSTVPVILQVAQSLRSGDIGQQYVVLFDPQRRETVATALVERIGSEYRYRFEGVRSGRYEIFAGTDLNNDGFICDPAEACGAYLTLDKPIDVDVTGDTTELNFVSGFSADFAQLQAAGSDPVVSIGRVGIARRPAQGTAEDAARVNTKAP